jgi:hypothetical protein
MLPRAISGQECGYCLDFRQGIRVVAPLSLFVHRLCEKALMPLALAEIVDTRRIQRLVRHSYTAGIVFLAALVVSVVCLAHASPPDPTWIPGIYDAGDFDDEILTVLSIDGTTITTPLAQRPMDTWRVLPSPIVSLDPSSSLDLPPSRSPPFA